MQFDKNVLFWSIFWRIIALRAVAAFNGWQRTPQCMYVYMIHRGVEQEKLKKNLAVYDTIAELLLSGVVWHTMDVTRRCIIHRQVLESIVHFRLHVCTFARLHARRVPCCGIKAPHRGPIFRRFHGMPWPPNGSLNVRCSCLTMFRCLDYINIDISLLQTGV